MTSRLSLSIHLSALWSSYDLVLSCLSRLLAVSFCKAIVY
uniref:Uncharacterized protein n=1 Tax=Escherichia virus LS3 TaxID=2743777 RepID=A0A7D5K8S9_9CAUD